MIKKITIDEVKSGYLKEHGRPITDEDLDAFFRMCELLEVIPEGSYIEVRNRCLEEMERLADSHR